jgi:hypothetical protein
MPQVLTTLAKVTCLHGLPGITTPMSLKWSIRSGFVAAENDTGKIACPICVGYTLKSMNLNTSTLEGRKVIMVTDFEQTDTGLPILMLETHKVFDNTISPAAASLSSPTAVPGMPAALTDMVPPTVSPPVASSTFVVHTQLPAAIPVVFNLYTAYPLRWQLIRVQEPALPPPPPPASPPRFDLTNGATGVTVTPSGGAWATPHLTVTLNLEAAYMLTLTPTPAVHHFYMIGVSRRGLFGYNVFDLTVLP